MIDFTEKIRNATEYVASMIGKQDSRSLCNDAANIFADTYEEYLGIWNALQGRE